MVSREGWRSHAGSRPDGVERGEWGRTIPFLAVPGCGAEPRCCPKSPGAVMTIALDHVGPGVRRAHLRPLEVNRRPRTPLAHFRHAWLALEPGSSVPPGV